MIEGPAPPPLSLEAEKTSAYMGGYDDGLKWGRVVGFVVGLLIGSSPGMVLVILVLIGRVRFP